jgi:uncharacterized protein YjgD (DUF1641 family)
MDNDLALLHQKIDLLTQTVEAQSQRLSVLEASGNGNGKGNTALVEKLDFMVQQSEEQRRSRQELEELKGDLLPIANHVIKLSIDELAEIGTEFQAEDLIFVLKRLLRDTKMLGEGLGRLESMMELFDETQDIGKQVFNQTVETLDQMERKGYFAFARGGWRMVERIVDEFSEDDVHALGDNIVLILNTVKDMTQPEIMHFVRNTLMVAEREIEQPVDVSYLGLLKQMREPEVRRGLALTMRVLHVIGAQAADNGKGVEINAS